MKRAASLIVVLALNCFFGACSNENAEGEKIIDHQRPSSSHMTEAALLDAQATAIPDGRLRVVGTTNLPDHTELLVTVSNETAGFSGQDKGIVKNGAFAAGPFGPEGGLPLGDYDISIVLPVPMTQSESAQRVTGAKGEYLTGPLIKESSWGTGKYVEYSFSYRKGSARDVAKAVAEHRGEEVAARSSVLTATPLFRQKAKALYLQMLEFRQEQDFILNGFGPSSSEPRYDRWLHETNALTDECREKLDQLLTPQEAIESELFPLCNAITDLGSLAVHYALGSQRDVTATVAALEKEFEM